MKLFEKSELKLLWPFYLEYFLASLLYLAPAFLTIYFLNIGFSLFQIGLIAAASGLAILVFEIPTGAFADLYGRKMSVLLGYFIEGVCMLSLFFIKDFYWVVLIFGLWGFGATFSSGSKDAWIVDMINKKNKKFIHGFFNKMQVFINLGSFFSGLLGVVIVKYFGISIIWPISAACYLASAVLLALFAKEIYTTRRIKVRDSFINLKTQTKKSLNYSYQHHVLFYLFIALVIFVFASQLQANISWVPLLKDLGMKDYQFGYLWSAMTLIVAISPIVGIKFLKKGKERNFIVLTIILGAVINLFILFAFNLLLAIPILLLSLFFFFSKNPAAEVYFHRFIPSKLRATVGSVRSMIGALASVIALPIAGLLVDWIGPKYTIFISSLLMIPAIILYLKIKEDKL
ncbi:MAG: MFS transporter [Candidatus Nanoarchaeia archaeon]|nr:MFS transporter [Candidatus Nanoarchaeia archaeon]MDD5740706.1 MFS transporter [Candidatus Nanoarchaeia archaeon]